jgi:iron complex outermembrane receptor protein
MKKTITFMMMLSILFSSMISAQPPVGTIRGKVNTTDQKAAAMVTVVLKGTKKSALSGDDGTFTIRNVVAGDYELEISLVGYETVSQHVTVQTNKATDLAFQLQVSDQQLQEVIVKSGLKSYKSNLASSSLRIETPILEMSQNIQIVTGKTLADQQVISMSDGLVRNVSGAVRMEHWGDLYTNISSRGSQIQAFRNGFNFVNSYWGPLTEDMSFVDHVEFVKGPAGFMLASGEPSGLYNVVTKKPTGQTKGEASFGVGSFDFYRTALDLDGKLNKDGRLLYRLNLAAQNKKSHRPNEYNNRYSIAPVISYQLDEKTKLTAEYNYQKAKMSDVGSYYVFSHEGFATLPVDFTMLPAGLPGTNIEDHSFFVNLRHQLAANWKLTGQLAHNRYRQIGTSTWPDAVNPGGSLQRAVSSWDAKSSMTMAQVFINGDITTGALRHRILGGIDMSNREYFADWGQYHVLDSVGGEFDVRNPYYGKPVNGYPAFDYTTPLEERATAGGGLMDQRNTALYIQDELGFMNNKIRLTLAGRYTYLSQAEWGDAAISDKHFTPRIGLSVSVDPNTSIYAVYDQAFIPQAGKLANGGKVKPVTGSNREIGIKRDWAGGKWNTTLAVYSIEKNNELTADPNTNPALGLSIVLGEKVSRGIEFDLRGKITNELSLIANYALTESLVTEVADGVTSMKEGDIVPGYAKHVANAWLHYKLHRGKLKGLGFSGGFTFLAGRETYWDVSPDPDQVLPDYFKLDGGVFWERDKINVTLNVFNILDKYLYSGSYYQWLNAYNWQTDPPRNARLSIAYRF